MLGVVDDGFALGGQLVDQRANASLIVGIGALKARHFRPHHGFQFAGARQCAFDAVAHRGDFATNGLRQRYDLLGGQGFRLSQTNGDLRHGLRGQAHFLRTPHDGRSGIKECDRAKRRQRKQRNLRLRHRRGVAGPQIETGKREPDGGRQRGDQRRLAARACLQRQQDLTNGGTVVVGCGTGVGDGRFNALFGAAIHKFRIKIATRPGFGLCLRFGFRFGKHLGRRCFFGSLLKGFLETLLEALLEAFLECLRGGISRALPGLQAGGAGPRIGVARALLLFLRCGVDEVQRLFDRRKRYGRSILSLGRIGHFRLLP